MKKVILLLFLFLPLSGALNAQEYETAIGVRGGLSYGLTVKHFFVPQTALEGILTTRWGGLMITGLYEIQQDLDHPGFSWYYGFGAHAGLFGGYESNPWFDDNEYYSVLGVDGVIGLEYVFEDVPLNISLDWKPALNLFGHSGFWGGDGALALRYILR